MRIDKGSSGKRMAGTLLKMRVGSWLMVSVVVGGCSSKAGPVSAGRDSGVGADVATGPEAGPQAGPEPGRDVAAEVAGVNDGPVASDAKADTASGPEAAADSRRAPDGSPDSGSSPDASADLRSGPDVSPDVRSSPDFSPEAALAPDASVDTGTPVYAGLPQPMCVWNEAYQENYAADTVAEILAGARGCYVLVDPFSNTDARSAIGQMKQNRNLASCYISVGTCEDWRDDFSAMKPYCVSKQWGEWPGEYFVDRTDPALVALMEARIDKMAGWGCNMVEFDNMDWAFDAANRSQYGITATAAQGETYNQTLCAYAHANGLGCMAKSSAQGATSFDGLTVESAPDNLDWWVSAHMQGMLSSGKIGIVVHYNETDCAAVRTSYQNEYGSKLSFICEDRALKKYRHFP